MSIDIERLHAAYLEIECLRAKIAGAWIAAAETLPSPNEWVLVYCNSGWLDKAFCDDQEDLGRVWRQWPARDEISDVLWWRPLGDAPPGIDWGKP